jgi:UDP-2-acetamido-3-amino-2,3-dideoxy-glucuronate N-acetyltransferase
MKARTSMPAATWAKPCSSIRRGASIGANARIVGGHEIGEYALVAARAIVTKGGSPFPPVARLRASPKRRDVT